MTSIHLIRCTAFQGSHRIASGLLPQVALAAKEVFDRGGDEPIYIFDDATSKRIHVDLFAPLEDLQRRFAANPDLPPTEPRGPDRHRLEVVAREVTLLPRHWEWLNDQPGGASVALRKLVEVARRVNAPQDRIRHAQDVAYRFMSSMAGDEPGFEEAARALFANNRAAFEILVDAWPGDLGNHVKQLALEAWW